MPLPRLIALLCLATLSAPAFAADSAQPWLAPWQGPVRNDVDSSSLEGKVLCGYQGWFRAPGDAAGGGWVHWSRDSAHIAPDTLTFEMWPDMAEYKKQYPAGRFTYPGGAQACLFSSADPETVNLHFDWMRDYGIDGVMVQQFLVDLGKPDTTRILGLVRQAANRTGRVFSLEFDMSDYPPDKALPAMQAYWRHLVDDLKITSDPRYLHQDGKPVLTIFGFFNDRFTGALANQMIDAFKQPGKYQACLVGSGQWSWRTVQDPAWARAFRRFDAIIPWNAGNYYTDAGVSHAQTNYWADDLAEATSSHMLYIPEFYPGFSWNNLQRTTANPKSIPRRGGDFLREQFQAAHQLGIRTAFVGMFDEVDEGTAIFKVTNTPPTQGYFATLEGKPSDYYLRITGEGTRLLRAGSPDHK